jgi:flagellar protein FlgJ
MSIISSPPSTSPPAQPRTKQEARLKKTALQMEGLFVQRLFAAMRDTVPDDGFVSQSNAQDTFTSLLDEKLAEQVPSQWNGEHSLATALYNQLRRRLSSAETTQQSASSGSQNAPTTAPTALASSLAAASRSTSASR